MPKQQQLSKEYICSSCISINSGDLFLSRSDNIMPPTLSFIVQLKQIKLDHCGIYSSIDNYLGCMFSININGFISSEPVCIFKKLNLLALTHDTKSRSLQTGLVSIGHQECFDS